MNRDTVIAILLLAFAGLYWLGADQIPRSMLSGGVSAQALPKLLAVALAILCAILLGQTLLTRLRAPADGALAPGARAPAVVPSRRHLRALGMLLIGVGYVVAVETVGYAPSILLLLGAVALYMGARRPVQVLAFAVLGAGLFWGLFVLLLGIRQPRGVWADLLANLI